jgi:hypothetical protein
MDNHLTINPKVQLVIESGLELIHAQRYCVLFLIEAINLHDSVMEMKKGYILSWHWNHLLSEIDVPPIYRSSFLGGRQLD